MFKAITAYSIKTKSKDVVEDLINKTNSKLGVYRPTTGILQVSCPHEPKKLEAIIKGICQAYPGIEILGGTVVGGYTDDSGYTKDGYFLCLLISDTTQLITGCIKNLSTLIRSNTFKQTFRTSLQQNFAIDAPKACLLYSAYNNVDGDVLIDDVQEVLPKECLVFGGVAADYWNQRDIENFSRKTPPAKKTLLFFAKDGIVHIEDDILVFLLFKGNITVKHGVSYGWSDIGTRYPGRAEGSILTELDGKNPRTFLREMKHPLALDEYDHVEYSLWFHVPGKDSYIRDIFFDKNTLNYSTQGSTLPSHFNVSFSFPSKEKVLKEFQNCLEKLAGQHNLVISIACCAHQVVLEHDISQEYTQMVRMFPHTPLICGYVFGEFGPSFTERKSILHSCSNILVCLGEANIQNDEREGFIAAFLHETIKRQSGEINSLKKQLRHFENSKNNKMKIFIEDCLGMLLCRSHKSLTSHAEQISDTMKAYYANSGIEPPYAISRNRVIEHLMLLKSRAEIFLDDKKR